MFWKANFNLAALSSIKPLVTPKEDRANEYKIPNEKSKRVKP